MQIFLNVIFALTTTVWIGSMFAFGALVAPLLFRRLPSRDQAGSIAGQIIARIETLGLVCSGILLMTTTAQAFNHQWQTLDLVRVLLVLAMLGLTAWSATTLRSRIEALRSQMGRPIDQVPEEDPLRQEHGKYHRLSRTAFMLVLLFGLALIVVSAMQA
jgi:uncharacterized membrane protein